jgi:hypothetical protein
MSKKRKQFLFGAEKKGKNEGLPVGGLAGG